MKTFIMKRRSIETVEKPQISSLRGVPSTRDDEAITLIVRKTAGLLRPFGTRKDFFYSPIYMTLCTLSMTMGYNPRVRKTLELKKSPDIKNRLAKVSRFLICGTRIPRQRRVCARGASVLWHDAYGAEPYRSIIRKAAGLGFPARGGCAPEAHLSFGTTPMAQNLTDRLFAK